MGLFNISNNTIPSNLINDKYFIPIDSVLDTKQGYWQNRKREWLKLGIKSEEGRKDNLTYGIGSFNYEDEKKRLKNNDSDIKSQQTSIFDPVLCELAYKWFSRKGDKVIDPFAGGSVRGIIAGILERNYTGIDLSESQIEANKQQYKDIQNSYTTKIIEPNWICGDSLNCKELANGQYNLLFTCPPYYDLEIYSNKDNDLSNLSTYSDFIRSYGLILKNAIDMLNDNSFAVIVVGNMRAKNKNKNYYNFVGDTIKIFQDCGMLWWNDLILVNVVGTLSVRTPIMFQTSRKIGKQHQNVLVFYKGDPNMIEYKFGKYDDKDVNINEKCK